MPRTRKFPKHTLQEALVVGQKIADENAGQPMDRLLLADALGIGASSKNYRDILSSSRTYGLTEGTEKAKDVSLTPLGVNATSSDTTMKRAALRKSALTPTMFKDFFERFDRNKLPSNDMLPRLLEKDFAVPKDETSPCAEMIRANGRWVGLIRDISGSPHVMVDGVMDESALSEPAAAPDQEDEDALNEGLEEGRGDQVDSQEDDARPPAPPTAPERPKAIFVGHGKNTGPLEKLEKILAGFQIPYKVAVSEPNLGRPIPTKVKETMDECGSAILIFTKDEQFFDEKGNEVWRPSENVVHELGAASFSYGDRIVIFKEDGLNLASNFSSVGYIEFQEDSIEAKTAELLQELIGFGLIKLTPAG